MRPSSIPPRQQLPWQPPGQRWGLGASSVLPYLTRAASATPSPDAEMPIRHPVFERMDAAVAARRPRG